MITQRGRHYLRKWRATSKLWDGSRIIVIKLLRFTNIVTATKQSFQSFLTSNTMFYTAFLDDISLSFPKMTKNTRENTIGDFWNKRRVNLWITFQNYKRKPTLFKKCTICRKINSLLLSTEVFPSFIKISSKRTRFLSNGWRMSVSLNFLWGEQTASCTQWVFISLLETS